MPAPTKPRCDFHPKRIARYSIMVEGGGVVEVCEKCRLVILQPKYPLYVCKYCGIPIKSPEDPSPAGRKEHKRGYYADRRGHHKNTWRPGCPRSEAYLEPSTSSDRSFEEAFEREDSDR